MYGVESSIIHTENAKASPNSDSDTQSDSQSSNLNARVSGILASHGSVHIHWTRFAYSIGSLKFD